MNATRTIRTWDAQQHRYVNTPIPQAPAKPTAAETLATANLREVLKRDARTGHTSSIASAVGICMC